MTSSLVKLPIGELEITSSVIAPLLAALPKLKEFAAKDAKVMGDADGADLIPRIPFFEGGNSVVFHAYVNQQCPQGPPNWIPPSAQFSDLEIDVTYLVHKLGLVNQWLSNSGTDPISLAIRGDPRSKL
jgi:hypothetical protein